jgi:putative membrane protein
VQAAVDTGRATRAGFRFPVALLGAFLIVFLILGIAPSYREDWLVENLLVAAALALLIFTRHRLRFSNRAYALLFVFLVLHEIGAHYTYALVPYDRWLLGLFGTSASEWMGLSRNHYDRVIHFAYGLLVLPAVIELLEHVCSPRGIWRVLLPVSFILAQSALYEMIEWVAALLVGGDLGVAYLGTQGDEWDAQKDMAAATVGALLPLLIRSSGRFLQARARHSSVPAVSQ